MKKFSYLILLGLVSSFLMFSSCKKDSDDPVAINESEVLATFLESADSPLGKDFVNTDMPTLIAASDVRSLQLTNQIYIMDIRGAADFAAGHIEGAVNVAYADIITHIKAKDLTPFTKVALVCYSGQSASYAASILRLLGYEKVFAMKFGMASWNETFAGSWNNNIGNNFATQFTAAATAKNPAGDMPKLSTGKSTGAEILEARANTLIAEGFTPASVTSANLFAGLANYYIVNYWPSDQYAAPGHVPGAVQYTPKADIKLSASLKTLPTDKPVAVYCYTGQTSAFLTAYLRLLGYDAKSVGFGTNSMIYDIMGEYNMTRFTPTAIMGYPYVIN